MGKMMGLFTVCALACMLMAGCASNADVAPSQSPALMPSTSPSASAGVMTSPGVQTTDGAGTTGMSAQTTQNTDGENGSETTETALKASKAVRDAVARLAEVENAVAVVVGDTALVGLEYDSQYKGETDERMRGMVLTRAQSVDKSVSKVSVTADQTQYKQIEALYQKLESGASLDDVRQEAQSLAGTLDKAD